MNKVLLIGNTCKENELRLSSTGIEILSNTIAVKRSTKDANGEYITDFISFVAFKNQAKFISQYCPKGSKIALDGSWQTRQYQANDGTMRYVNELIVNSVELLRSSQEAQPQQPTPYQQPQTTPTPAFKPVQQPQYQAPSYSSDPFADDIESDLPF